MVSAANSPVEQIRSESLFTVEPCPPSHQSHRVIAYYYSSSRDSLFSRANPVLPLLSDRELLCSALWQTANILVDMSLPALWHPHRLRLFHQQGLRLFHQWPCWMCLLATRTSWRQRNVLLDSWSTTFSDPQRRSGSSGSGSCKTKFPHKLWVSLALSSSGWIRRTFLQSEDIPAGLGGSSLHPWLSCQGDTSQRESSSRSRPTAAPRPSILVEGSIWPHQHSYNCPNKSVLIIIRLCWRGPTNDDNNHHHSHWITQTKPQMSQ